MADLSEQPRIPEKSFDKPRPITENSGMGIDDFKTEEEYVSQMEHGALLNPRLDSTFKALFTQPTEESRAALKSFLEAATERRIRTAELRPNDAPGGYAGQRGVSYDITCELDDGRAAEIELQSFNQKYDYGKRAEYQVARLETTYLGRGQDWKEAPIVFQITILGFVYTKQTKRAVNRFAMRTKDGVELSNTLNIVFVELPKIRRLEKSVETNTRLENWAIFLRDADKPQKQGLVQRLTEKEEGLMNAQRSLSTISRNRSYWIAQYHQELHDRDIRSGLHAAEQKGVEKGRAEGERNKAIETARNFLKMGLTIQQIAQGTGLSEEEISSL